jgi:hypothetical protein
MTMHPFSFATLPPSADCPHGQHGQSEMTINYNTVYIDAVTRASKFSSFFSHRGSHIDNIGIKGEHN